MVVVEKIEFLYSAIAYAADTFLKNWMGRADICGYIFSSQIF